MIAAHDMNIRETPQLCDINSTEPVYLNVIIDIKPMNDPSRSPNVITYNTSPTYDVDTNENSIELSPDRNIDIT